MTILYEIEHMDSGTFLRVVDGGLEMLGQDAVAVEVCETV